MKSVERMKSSDFPGQRVDTTATTRVELKTHKIRWRIYNFSSIPDEVDVPGPCFKPNSWTYCSINMRKSKSHLNISLQLSKHCFKDYLSCKCETSICCIQGKSFYSHVREFLLEKDNKVSLLEEHLQLNELLEKTVDDALIIECTFESKRISTFVHSAKRAAPKAVNYFSDFYNRLKHHLKAIAAIFLIRVAVALIIAAVIDPVPARLVAVRVSNRVIAKPDLDLTFPKELYTGQCDMFRDGNRYVNMDNEDENHNHKGGEQVNSDKGRVYKLHRDAQVLKNFGAVILFKMKSQNASHAMDWAEKYNGGDLKNTASHDMNEYFDNSFRSIIWKTFLMNHTRLASEIVQLCKRARSLKDSDVLTENEG